MVSTKRTILLVEDEESITTPLAEALERDGFHAEVAHTVADGLALGRSLHPDLVLLDLMLPDGSGLDVCRALRAESSVPIIILSARGEETDRVVGLELGADDYVTKPFSPRELRARIKAVLRRVDQRPADVHRFGEVEADFTRGELRRGGRPVEATAMEMRLLAAFVRNRGRVLTREQLLDHAWGHGTHVGDRVVDTHILNLRKKIEPQPGTPRYIVSVRGLGYRFDG